MPRHDIERSFAGLVAGGYRITSPGDASYNCVAWAVEESDRWWDPSPGGGYYWPGEVPPVLSLSHLTAALATRGYEPCADAEPEPGYAKVAIYADDHGWPTHVARQLPSGVWTSKLGAGEDIEHATVQGLEGPLYGRAVRFLRKRRS